MAPATVGLSAQRLEEVHELLQDITATKRLAGVVALVARRGEVAWVDAVGLQDLEAGTPMRPDTLFRICSMTQPITSVAAMMLVEEGRIGLDDPISAHVPELKGLKVLVESVDPDASARTFREEPAAREITLRHLLTHTSGLSYGFWGRVPLGARYREAGVSDGLVETAGTQADNVRRLGTVPLLFQPGEGWEYGLSTDVLGLLIERVSGQALDAFFRERIFEPLGMRDTSFRVPPEKISRLATVYQPRPDGTVERLPEGTVMRGTAVYSSSYPYAGEGRYLSGGAGLVSTAGDYARLLLLLAGEGEWRGARLLKRESVKAMTRSQCGALPIGIQAHGDAFGFGFGVVTEAAKDWGLGSVGTYSWGGFYFTYFWVDPAEELVGVLLAQLQPWGEQKHWDNFRELTYRCITDE